MPESAGECAIASNRIKVKGHLEVFWASLNNIANFFISNYLQGEIMKTIVIMTACRRIKVSLFIYFKN